MMNPEAVEAINLWKNYYLKKTSGFWIYHKFDQMGRPFDAQMALDEISIEDSSVRVHYDRYREILIHKPSNIELIRDKAGTIRLEFTQFESLEKILLDYGIEAPNVTDFKHTRMQKEGDDFRLVGHSPNIWNPESETDTDYRKLFLASQLREKW
jgi:hypothetical protein